MRSLTGYDYTVLFCATPISAEDVQDKYSAVLQIRDTCAAVSKRNISLQNNINKTRTTTQNTTRRGLVQEALKQAVREKKFNGRALLDSIIDGGACSSSVSEVETLEALTSGVSFDMQNGIAIEMAEFCDKAIERLKLVRVLDFGALPLLILQKTRLLLIFWSPAFPANLQSRQQTFFLWERILMC